MNNHSNKSTDIAIIGISCKLPKANSLKDYIENITNGKKCFSVHSLDTLENLTSFERSSGGDYIPVSSTIDDIKGFDADFFNISPQDATIMEPQHRMLLEGAWSALEDSGYIAKRQNLNIGVYCCCGKNTYLLSNILCNDKVSNNTGIYQMMIGNYNDFISTRISYKLGLSGPSMSLQSACSSSLTSLHYACQDLLQEYCNVAIVGASTIRATQEVGYIYEESGIFSQNGECLPFDDRANGTIPGNGVGVLVLKRFQEAIDDNDHIYAIIKGCSINCDGNDKIGYTAPGINGQKNVILDCLNRSGISPENVEFIEAHGTGTKLGDPIEFEALKQAYVTSKKNYCAIGSVKWQIGHLDATAGMAGIIKAVLCLQHKIIPSSPYLNEINKYIKIEDSPFYIPKCNKVWESNGKCRYAGVSSFGLGGTNAHVILMEAPETKGASVKSNKHVILPFSAKTPKALKELVDSYISFFTEIGTIDLQDVSYTLWNGRNHFKENRTFVVCNTVNEAIDKLQGLHAKPGIEKVYIDIASYIIYTKPVDENKISCISNGLLMAYLKCKNSSLTKEGTSSMFHLALALFNLLKNLNVKVCLYINSHKENELRQCGFSSLLDRYKNEYQFLYVDDDLFNSQALVVSNENKGNNVNQKSLEEIAYLEILDIIGQLWCSGNVIPDNLMNLEVESKFISLPTYPFQHKDYWVEATPKNVDTKNIDTNYRDVLKTVISLWKDILGVEFIGDNDDFFNIGGDSLSAVRFLSRINAIYKVKVSLDEFMQITSATDTMKLIESRINNIVINPCEIKLFEENPLRKMKDGDDSTPIVIFHPAGGTTFCYHELLKNTKINSAIYGFQFPIDLLESNIKKIPELSIQYLKIIENTIKSKSYYLAGYSMGGNLAFEIATLMQKSHINVLGLYLIDSHAPIVYNKEISDPESLMDSFPFILKSFLKIETDGIINGTNIEVIYNSLKLDNDILNAIPLKEFTMLYHVWKYNHLSLRAYDHQYKFKGDVILFEAEEKESTESLRKMGMVEHEKKEWEKYIDGQLQIISVPGNHFTMLSTPNVEVLSSRLSMFKL